jgi:hypothetical protein
MMAAPFGVHKTTWGNPYTFNMDALPQDLLVKTFKQLDPISLCRLSQVSKEFKVHAEDDEVWLVCHGFRKKLTKAHVLYEVDRMETRRARADTCRDIVGGASRRVAMCYSNSRVMSDVTSRTLSRLGERFSDVRIQDLHMRQSVAYTNSEMFIEGLMTGDWETARNSFDRSLQDLRIAQDALNDVMADLRDAEYFEWSADTDVSILRYSLGVPLRLRTWLDVEKEWRTALRLWTENDSPDNFEEVYRLGLLLSHELGILDNQLIY